MWRQIDLAKAASVSQPVISELERGILDDKPIRTVRSVAPALDARLALELRWRGAEVDRLLDERHAALVETAVRQLHRWGWETAVEVSYSEWGERGSYGFVGWHRQRRALVVGEAKWEVAAIEGTNRRHDQKMRLAPRVVRARFGWHPAVVGRLLVLPSNTSARRRIAAHAETFRSVLPARGSELRAWLRTPVGSIAGIWFLPVIASAYGRRRLIGPKRVRCPKESDGRA